MIAYRPIPNEILVYPNTRGKDGTVKDGLIDLVNPQAGRPDVPKIELTHCVDN